MRKILRHYISTAIVAAIVTLCVVVPVSAAGNEVKLYTTPLSQSTTVGDTVAVQVRLTKDSNAKVDYAYADIRYSSSVLEVVGVSRSGSYFSENNGPVTNFNNGTGALSISGSGDTLPTTANVLVATVTFRLKSATSGTVSFAGGSMAGDQLGGGNVKNALTSTSGSTLTGVSAPASSPTKPTTSPGTQPAPTPPPTTQETPPTPPDTKPEAEASESPKESEIVTTAVAQDTASNDSKPGLFGLELWQLIAGGVVTLILLGTGVFLFLAQTRKGDLGLPTATETQDVQEDPESQLPNEKEFFQETPVPDIFSQGNAESETNGTLAQASVAEPSNDGQQQSVVDGVAIEPLDPNMPTPLPDVALEQPASNTQIVSTATETISPETPQPQAVSLAPATDSSTADDEFPDMFEEGEARLKAEGLDQQLGGSKR